MQRKVSWVSRLEIVPMLLGVEYPWVGPVLMLLSIPALVVLNGLFVAAEFALVTIRKTRVEEMVHQGIKGAKTLESALQHLDRTIAATQLGVTLASIGLGWVGEPALARLIQPLFASLAEAWKGPAIHTLATAVAFILITYMHVVFGELLPKNLALHTPDWTALWVAKPLAVFAMLTRPLTLLMTGTANQILRLLGYPPLQGEELIHSVEELTLLIEDVEEAGVLGPDQADFVQNVFRLSGKRVRDCLVPRERMAVLELNTPPDKVLESVRAGAHTRMPVYEGDLDHVVGVVNTKDLFYLFSLRGVVILEDALYPPLYLKPGESMANALALFRKTRHHMALVRDEDGQILGLITLEDVIEEIVGDIEDEHDRPTPKLSLRSLRRALSAKAVPPNRK